MKGWGVFSGTAMIAWFSNPGEARRYICDVGGRLDMKEASIELKGAN